MRAVIQRVSQANVTVNEVVVGSIGHGYLILLGVGQGDNAADADYLVEKIAHLRIFEDTAGKMNLSLQDVGGEALVISQFTLYADTKRGRRPSFSTAAPAEEANHLYQYFCERLALESIPIARGIFQAHMSVSLVNDGPVTLFVESR
jgi:D-tyrosyl-tRNA(Tyr) deacylase